MIHKTEFLLLNLKIIGDSTSNFVFDAFLMLTSLKLLDIQKQYRLISICHQTKVRVIRRLIT